MLAGTRRALFGASPGRENVPPAGASPPVSRPKKVVRGLDGHDVTGSNEAAQPAAAAAPEAAAAAPDRMMADISGKLDQLIVWIPALEKLNTVHEKLEGLTTAQTALRSDVTAIKTTVDEQGQQLKAQADQLKEQADHIRRLQEAAAAKPPAAQQPLPPPTPQPQPVPQPTAAALAPAHSQLLQAALAERVKLIRSNSAVFPTSRVAANEALLAAWVANIQATIKQLLLPAAPEKCAIVGTPTGNGIIVGFASLSDKRQAMLYEHRQRLREQHDMVVKEHLLPEELEEQMKLSDFMTSISEEFRKEEYQQPNGRPRITASWRRTEIAIKNHATGVEVRAGREHLPAGAPLRKRLPSDKTPIPESYRAASVSMVLRMLDLASGTAPRPAPAGGTTTPATGANLTPLGGTVPGATPDVPPAALAATTAAPAATTATPAAAPATPAASRAAPSSPRGRAPSPRAALSPRERAPSPPRVRSRSPPQQRDPARGKARAPPTVPEPAAQPPAGPGAAAGAASGSGPATSDAVMAEATE